MDTPDNTFAGASMVIKSGNVGIGTITPAAKLDVNSSAIIRTNLTVQGLINMQKYAVTNLPVGTIGDVCCVTNALLPSFLTTVAGGGSVVTPVFFDGTAWKSF